MCPPYYLFIPTLSKRNENMSTEDLCMNVHSGLICKYLFKIAKNWKQLKGQLIVIQLSIQRNTTQQQKRKHNIDKYQNHSTN